MSLSIGPLLPAIHGGHEAWRYTILWGILPAIPLLIVRPFLPESPIWKKKREEGTLQRPSILELFHPEFRKTALLSCFMMACAYAASFGMLQHFARIIPGAPEVKILAHADQQKIVSALQGVQEVGSLFGRILMAVLAIFILSRKRLLHIFQIPGLLLIPLVVLLPAMRDTAMPAWGIFILGTVSVAQFSFWGNYLPTLYPTHLRGTGESFAANVGGRMLGTSAALITTTHRDVHARRHRHAATRLRGGNRRLSRLRRRFHRQVFGSPSRRRTNYRIAVPAIDFGLKTGCSYELPAVVLSEAQMSPQVEASSKTAQRLRQLQPHQLPRIPLVNFVAVRRRHLDAFDAPNRLANISRPLLRIERRIRREQNLIGPKEFQPAPQCRKRTKRRRIGIKHFEIFLRPLLEFPANQGQIFLFRPSPKLIEAGPVRPEK